MNNRYTFSMTKKLSCPCIHFVFTFITLSLFLSLYTCQLLLVTLIHTTLINYLPIISSNNITLTPPPIINGNNLVFQMPLHILLPFLLNLSAHSLYCHLRQKIHSHQWTKKNSLLWFYTLSQKHPRCNISLYFFLDSNQYTVYNSFSFSLMCFLSLDVGRSDSKG